MIKLIKILSEIKIIGNVTPEMVEDLITSFKDDDRKIKKWQKILYGYGWDEYLPSWLDTLDQKTLNQIYKELQKI